VKQEVNIHKYVSALQLNILANGRIYYPTLSWIILRPFRAWNQESWTCLRFHRRLFIL